MTPLSAAVLEQTALLQLGRAADAETAALVRQMNAVRSISAGASAAAKELPKRETRDVFHGCPAIEERARDAAHAVILVQICLNNAYPSNASFSLRAVVVENGLKITVSGQIPLSDPVGALEETLTHRSRRLLGFPVVLDDQTESIAAFADSGA